MKRESNTYDVKGKASINTNITSQTEVMSDIRSIQGITTTRFSPIVKDDPLVSYDNSKYEGELDIKVDTFPFEKFDKKTVIKNIILQIRKIPAINFYNPSSIDLIK